MKRALLMIFFIAAAAQAQVVATAGRNIVVAHDSRIEWFDESGRAISSVAGVEHPSFIATDGDRIAVVDSLANQITNERGERIATGETPVAALFVNRNLYVLARDANRLERIGGGSVAVAPDAAFLRAANGRIYVYSRVDGIVQEIAPETMRITRTVTVAPAASDFETDGRTGYLVFPRDAKVRTFSLATMQRGGEIAVGAVPVDIAISSHVAVADPSAKRVWVVERTQSFAQAFARGFIRGLLGFGLFEARNSDLPTGVDRVASRGSMTVAYDSSSGTLYRLSGSRPNVIARDVAPQGFALTGNGIALWQNGALRLIR